ncbi:MAG TPA: CHRD domain-containing protein [Anaerolineales bacterium]|nr:CHRD domain-containing protein [Anaerolineales bacterium]
MKKIAIVPIILIMIVVLALPGAVSAGGRPFSTTLTGEAEVTVEGVPNQGDLDGIGTAHLALNQGQGEICYELTVSGIAPAAAAHIHVGASTTTGPVVVPLEPPTDGSSSACASVDRELIKAIRQNPENYYVNVHNADFPGGALRGQLSK